MAESLQNFSVIGAGAWGTALALCLLRAGRNVTLWCRSQEQADSLNSRRENQRYLPGVPLPGALHITHDPVRAAATDALFLVVPAQYLRTSLPQFTPHLRPGTPLIICAKGIERGTHQLLDAVVAELAPNHPIAALSGPSFAAEVSLGLPTAITLACEDAELTAKLCAALATPAFRPYASSDVRGVLLGGALKNVLAIAAGITLGYQQGGRNLGDNARATIITRGLAELMRLSVALGARPETLMGLSGLGDLMLTCLGDQSRNLALGIALGEGKSLEEILQSRNSVAEGASTARAAKELAAQHGIEVPLISAVAEILQGGAIEPAIKALLQRPLKAE